MTILHKERSPYSFPDRTDMLAAFGLEAEVDEFFQSLTYTFRSQETELVVTYSEWRRYLVISMSIQGGDVFHLDMPHVMSVHIRSERDARWLQVAYEPEHKMPDMHIHLEPTLRCQWIMPPSPPDIP